MKISQDEKNNKYFRLIFVLNRALYALVWLLFLNDVCYLEPILINFQMNINVTFNI